MKKIYTLFLAALAVQAATAQNLEIRDELGTVLNTDTVDHVGNASDFDIQAHGYRVYNIGSSNVDVSCTRYEVNTVTGTANALCWTVCSMDYAADAMPVLTAPGGGQTITPGNFCDLFVLHYKPLNNPGMTLYKVTFVNTALAGDSAYFYVRFNATVSVPELYKNITINAYPNPASSFINVEVSQFNEGTSIKIVDMLGATVKTVAVNSTNTRISTADLREGVYFYSLVDRNKTILTRRMLISR